MIEYHLIRSKRKSLSLQIKPDGTLEARAPLSMSKASIEKFIGQKRRWIDKHQQIAIANHKRIMDKQIDSLLIKGKIYPILRSEEIIGPCLKEEHIYVPLQYQ